ncbi:MAG: hypothetical protein IJN54_08505 [Lachnospiraceae bacterium]|nr:hypothetical protein [Lachnospiraceae bacterium]
MNKEIEFAKTLQEVVNRAKDNGNCISKEEVEEAFASQNLKEEQLELVLDYLVKHKIGIGEPVDLDDYLSEEDKNYLDEYLAEIEALKTFSQGEKEAITMSAMAGDADAQRQLIEIYIPQVVDVAKLYAGQGVFLEDLIGEGNLAVTLGVTQIGCLEHPSEADGMMGKLMMDAMEDYITENTNAEEMDKKMADRVNDISDKAKELAESFGRKITPKELAEETGIKLEDIVEAVRMSGDNIEYIENDSND